MKLKATIPFLIGMVSILGTLCFGGQAMAECPKFSGNEGATIVPVENTQVEMLDQQVTLTQGDEWWHATAVYYLKNTSKKEEKVTIYMPFPAARDEFICWNEQKNPNDAKLKDFQVKVRDQKLDSEKDLSNIILDKKWLKKKKLGDLYTNAYSWQVTFKPDETVKLETQFKFMESFDEGDVPIIFYGLQTGRFWKSGKIGQTQIELSFNNKSCLLEDVFPFSVDDVEIYIKSSRAGASSFNLGLNSEDLREKYPRKRIDQDGQTRLIWNLKDFKSDVNLAIQYLEFEEDDDGKVGLNSDPENAFASYSNPDPCCLPWDTQCWQFSSQEELIQIRNALKAVLDGKWQKVTMPNALKEMRWYAALKKGQYKKLPSKLRDLLLNNLETVESVINEKKEQKE